MHNRLQSLVTLKARPPEVPPGLVTRPRLTLALDQATRRPLTLVSAGPGAGKTLAVAAWIGGSALGAPVAWLSLDSGDNDPQAFWTQIVGALRNSGAVPESSSLLELMPAASFGPDEVLSLVARLSELPRPVVLVLDDFHPITADAVLTAFERLLEHQPTNLHLVLLTRADPALRLHRLRVSGALTEIRTADLTFTQEETTELFDGLGMTLRPEQLGALLQRTEGWPAGLRLAAMSLDPSDVDAGIQRFSGSDRSVAEYLVGEVMDGLPAQDRGFLLATAVPERISGALADRLTGRCDGAQALEKLVAANALIVGLGGEREWFTYHPLLLELLRHRLALEMPLQVADLHRRTAQWLAEQGDPIDAMRHWIQAGDLAVAGRMLLTVLPRLLSPDGPALAAVIEPLARTANDSPSLSSLLASAGFHLHRLDEPAMRRDAMEAREYLDQAPPDLRVAAEVVVELFLMAAARYSGDTAAAGELATRVVGLLDSTPSRLIPSGRHYRAIAIGNLGSAEVWLGDFAEADGHLAAGEHDSAELGLHMVSLNALGHRSVLDALRGRLRQADRRSRSAVQIIERRGWASEPQAVTTWLTLALVAVSRARLDSAGGHIDRGLAMSVRYSDRAARLTLAIAAVELAVLRGDQAAAFAADARLQSGLSRTAQAPLLLRRWAEVAGADAQLLAGRPAEVLGRIPVPDDDGFAASLERICRARAHLALSQLRPAADLLEPLLVIGYPYLEPAIQARLLHALIAERQHRDSAALAAITEAIDLAQPESLRRPFLALPATTDLLRRYERLGGRHATFVAELLAALEPAPAATADSSLLVEHLTERELIVLHYLPTMLKAGEIASDLYVSVNTVKAHLRSMYRKLGVSNRREAVERARKVGLLK